MKTWHIKIMSDRIRIPASLNDEDVFLSWGPIKLSMRQLATATAGVFLWIGVAKYMIMPLLSFTLLPALLATSWILAIFMALAFVKIRQRPIDQWIGEKINFLFSPQTFVLQEQKEDRRTELESDLYRDEDLDSMLETLPRTRSF